MNTALGFAGSEFEGRLWAGEEACVTWKLSIKRQIFRFTVYVNETWQIPSDILFSSEKQDLTSRFTLIAKIVRNSDAGLLETGTRDQKTCVKES